jgi:methyl-accepting chemotaxis protein
VKILAGKSAEAAKETANLIGQAVKSVEEGELIGKEVQETTAEAVKMTEEVSIILDQVNQASTEQVKGATHVTQAAGQISNAIQQTAASSEETTSAGRELLGQAEFLSRMVIRLDEVVKGARNGDAGEAGDKDASGLSQG